MLKVISLHCINQIFETEALVKISPKAKIAYMQCLIYHFADVEPTYDNMLAFDIMKFRVNPKSMKLFEELDKAGLVQIHEKWITFINHWGKHIDRTLLPRVSPTEYLATADFRPAEEFMEEILKKASFYEIAQMQMKIPPERTAELIKLFFKTQDAHEQAYQNHTAASRHCLGWIRGQITGTGNNNSKKQTTNNATKQLEPGQDYGSL